MYPFMITLIVVIAENYYIWRREVMITQATFMFYFSMNFRQWIFWLQCCFCMQKRKRLFGFWLLYVNECYLIILIVESLVKISTHTWSFSTFLSQIRIFMWYHLSTEHIQSKDKVKLCEFRIGSVLGLSAAHHFSIVVLFFLCFLCIL